MGVFILGVNFLMSSLALVPLWMSSHRYEIKVPEERRFRMALPGRSVDIVLAMNGDCRSWCPLLVGFALPRGEDFPRVVSAGLIMKDVKRLQWRQERGRMVIGYCSGSIRHFEHPFHMAAPEYGGEARVALVRECR